MSTKAEYFKHIMGPNFNFKTVDRYSRPIKLSPKRIEQINSRNEKETSLQTRNATIRDVFKQMTDSKRLVTLGTIQKVLLKDHSIDLSKPQLCRVFQELNIKQVSTSSLHSDFLRLQNEPYLLDNVKTSLKREHST